VFLENYMKLDSVLVGCSAINHRAICSRHFKGTHCLYLRWSSQAVCSIEMSATACPPSDAASYPRRTERTSPSSCAVCHGNLGAWTSWNPLGHAGPVTGLLYLLPLPLQPHIGWVGVQSEVLKFMFILHYVTEVLTLLNGPEVYVLW